MMSNSLVTLADLVRLIIGGASVSLFLLVNPVREASQERLTVAVKPAQPARLQLTLRRGDTLSMLVNRYGVKPPDAQELIAKLRSLVDPKTLQAGRQIELLLDPQQRTLQEMTIAMEDEVVRAAATPDGWAVQSEKMASTAVTRVVHDAISRSLYDNGVAAGLSPQHISQLAEIFEYDIDFFSDVKRGDRFSVVVEERQFANGRRVPGKISAAELDVEGKRHEAFYFSPGSERGSYYDRDGKQLRRTFLRAPLNYTRVSSLFSRSRWHPIFRVARPHEAIDYAAPHGTPVVAIGRGRVSFSGWRVGYGNLVEIIHPGGYASRYGHFSRVARGLRRGVEVNAGDIIGYVGQTGHATGPHLHFEFLQSGRKVNFLNMRIPRVDRLSGSLLERFRQERDRSLDLLRRQNSGAADSQRS